MVIGITDIDEIYKLNPNTFTAMCKGALGSRFDNLIDQVMVSSSVKPVAFIEDATSQNQQFDDYIRHISEMADSFGNNKKVRTKLSHKQKLEMLGQVLYDKGGE